MSFIEGLKKTTIAMPSEAKAYHARHGRGKAPGKPLVGPRSSLLKLPPPGRGPRSSLLKLASARAPRQSSRKLRQVAKKVPSSKPGATRKNPGPLRTIKEGGRTRRTRRRSRRRRKKRRRRRRRKSRKGRRRR